VTSPHILIVGSGSVGRRHARNLSALGCRISCMDPREDRREELARETPVIEAYATMDAALNGPRMDGVVVGSPTAFHVEQSTAALKAGLPVLLEKPAAIGLAEAEALSRTVAETSNGADRLLMGYTWRWWPPLARVRELLADGAIGRLLHVQFHMSAHLADWHPWERYQVFFMASRALGGGALLDESHWIDLMLWLVGKPDWVLGECNHISGLEIETDDNVDVLAGFIDGTRVTLHLDLYGRPHEKSIRFQGEEGTLLWSDDPSRIAIGRGPAKEWQEEIFACERNDMFLAVAKEFLKMIAGAPPRTCTMEDGVEAMRVIEAIRRSSAEGRRVKLKEIAG
jgi:predicted dehydrogenase